MISIIDAEIDRLHNLQRNLRLNDPESDAEFAAAIVNLRALKKGLVNVQKAAVEFPAGKVAEGKLAKVLKEIAAPFREFWKKDGAKRINNTSRMGIGCCGYALACHFGMPVPAASLLASAVYSKAISNVLKAGFGNLFAGHPS